MTNPLPALILGLLLTAAFAGCLGDPGTSADATDTASTSGPSTTAPTTSAAPNIAPELVVKILLNGTELALQNGSYMVAALANITFDASGSTDADGHPLTFSWSFGDNATSVEPVVEHAYAQAGNYTVQIKVSDGITGDTDELPMVVAEAGPLRTDTKTFSGNLKIGTQDPVIYETACAELGQEDVDQKTFEWTFVDKEADGTLSYVKHVRIGLDSSGDAALDVDIFFLDPAGKELGKGTSPGADEKIELANVRLGPGKYTIRVEACNVADIDIAVKAEAEYYRA